MNEAIQDLYTSLRIVKNTLKFVYNLSKITKDAMETEDRVAITKRMTGLHLLWAHRCPYVT